MKVFFCSVFQVYKKLPWRIQKTEFFQTFGGDYKEGISGGQSMELRTSYCGFTLTLKERASLWMCMANSWNST